MHRLTAAVLVAATTAAYAAPLDYFLPPEAGAYAANADIVNVTIVPDASTCATACLALPPSLCISFNLCMEGADLHCGLSAWNVNYTGATSATCSWYRRSVPRNDTRITQAVPWILQVPTGNVSLSGTGPIAQAFQGNVENYLHVRDPLDMLFFFAKRAGVVSPPGHCFGWDLWIRGSGCGNYLMGAGGALRYVPEDTLLRTNVQQVVDGISSYVDNRTGWVWAFNETDIDTDNLPDYCASWVTRGLLDADSAGITGAIDLARQSVSLFNNHTYLPMFMPPNGGPNPVQPYPSGFNNVTSGGYGQASGHMIYIQYQGMIKHTLMALSRLGTQADIDIIQDHLQEDWWLTALLNRDTFHGIFHRQFFSHNYEVTAFEAFLDMYVLTGNTTYLNAMLNAWDLLRQQWILPGGSFAINEGSYYPPSSYYIGFTGVNVAVRHHHDVDDHEDHVHSEAGDPYYHAPCMPGPGAEEPYVSPLVRLRADAKAPGAPGLLTFDDEKSSLSSSSSVKANGPNDSDPPTGELCGSVFWTKFNQRFHRLYPENETFVLEMERSIINVGAAALGWPGSGGQGPNGTGIRYFANQHKYKQLPSMHASCCEGQGTRLFGSLPEYIYTLVAPMSLVPGQPQPASGIYVDLYAASNISFLISGGGSATLVQTTEWPYGSDVALSLTLPTSQMFDLVLRIPSWVASAANGVVVTVNGKAWSTTGTAGSYLHITQTWPAGASSITFSLPMQLEAVQYMGASQLPPTQRWGYLYGPILLASQGPWNSTLDTIVMPSSLSPSSPNSWFTPAGDGNTLHFNVSGFPEYTFKPYYEVQGDLELFTVYPSF